MKICSFLFAKTKYTLEIPSGIGSCGGSGGNSIFSSMLLILFLVPQMPQLWSQSGLQMGVNVFVPSLFHSFL